MDESFPSPLSIEFQAVTVRLRLDGGRVAAYPADRDLTTYNERICQDFPLEFPCPASNTEIQQFSLVTWQLRAKIQRSSLGISN